MWILIDLSYLAHRALHAMDGMENEDIPTGVMFGFFEQLYTVCSNIRFASNKIGVFTDSRKSYRSRAFPAYKKKRREDRTEEEQEKVEMMYEQVRILKKEWLPDMGIPVYGQVGLESDDLLAQASLSLTKEKERGTVITSDGDLYQCISPYISWYDPQRNLYYDHKNFEEKKGISYEKWGMVKAIGGCSTDCVPGIKDVSEKGAIDFILDKLPHHYKKYQTITSIMPTDTFELWKELTMLPHRKTKPVELKLPEYDPKSFFDYCKKYGMDSYLEGQGKAQWQAFFKGQFIDVPMIRREKKILTRRRRALV